MVFLKWWLLPIALALGCFWFCKKGDKKTLIVPAFYYWKHNEDYNYYGEAENSFRSNGLDSALMKHIAPQRLYVKFFDIDWREGNGAYPRQAYKRKNLPSKCQIVPVFYILNRVFEKSDSLDLENLAMRLENITNLTYPEIQLDCDWTSTTRDRYFQLLRLLRKKLNPAIKLSVTIRLHQIKFRDKTGIPPADRGMLMVYNFRNPAEYNEHNSIFEAEEALKYLEGQKAYTLPLDVALPLFRWGIAYRGGKFNVLLNGLGFKEADALRFLKKDGRFYTVTSDTVFKTNYLRFGDKIKIEEVNDEALIACAHIAAPFVHKTDTLHIAFFHYDNALISSFKPETYEQVFKIFTR